MQLLHFYTRGRTWIKKYIYKKKNPRSPILDYTGVNELLNPIPKQMNWMKYLVLEPANFWILLCECVSVCSPTHDRKVKWSKDSSARGCPECFYGSGHSRLWSTAQTAGQCSRLLTSSWNHTRVSSQRINTFIIFVNAHYLHSYLSL